jgi:hypothetical protein
VEGEFVEGGGEGGSLGGCDVLNEGPPDGEGDFLGGSDGVLQDRVDDAGAEDGCFLAPHGSSGEADVALGKGGAVVPAELSVDGKTPALESG